MPEAFLFLVRWNYKGERSMALLYPNRRAAQAHCARLADCCPGIHIAHEEPVSTYADNPKLQAAAHNGSWGIWSVKK